MPPASKPRKASKGALRPAAAGTKATVAKKPAAAKRSAGAKRPAAAVAQRLPPAVVVNLARRPDRWERIRQRLQDLAAFDFERVEAVDGAAGLQIPADIVAHSWNTLGNWRYVTRVFEGGKKCGYEPCELTLTTGERGCAASHVALWRRVADDAGPLMVFEDDALPLQGFADRLAQALADLGGEEPDLLYLGYTQAAPWRRKVSKSVVEAEYLWTTVGYVIWPSGARKLLAQLPVDQPVDNFMATHIAGGRLRGFAVVPLLVKQEGEWNVDNDVAHSDDKAWVQNR